MDFIKEFGAIGKGDAASAGGKGASLGEMTNAGIPVPPGFVILASAFEQFLDETNLNTEIDTILHTVDQREMGTVEKASANIQALVLNAKMPDDIAATIQEFYKKLDADYVAVRSSATADQDKLYQLTDKSIPEVIQQLRELVPVSIFSNNRLNTLLPALGLELNWFTHVLGPDVVKSPKPNLEGFYKMIELSGEPADEILYIGDDVDKDIIPAKKAGIRAGLLWESSADADYSFADFQAILALVQTVNKVQ